LLKSRCECCILVLQECVLETGPCSFKAMTKALTMVDIVTIFVVLRAEVFGTIVSWASRWRYFLGEVSSLSRIVSNFSSVSTVPTLSGFSSSSDLVSCSLCCYTMKDRNTFTSNEPYDY
jgi:hypothetical protein